MTGSAISRPHLRNGSCLSLHRLVVVVSAAVREGPDEGATAPAAAGPALSFEHAVTRIAIKPTRAGRSNRDVRISFFIDL